MHPVFSLQCTRIITAGGTLYPGTCPLLIHRIYSSESTSDWQSPVVCHTCERAILDNVLGVVFDSHGNAASAWSQHSVISINVLPITFFDWLHIMSRLCPPDICRVLGVGCRDEAILHAVRHKWPKLVGCLGSGRVRRLEQPACSDMRIRWFLAASNGYVTKHTKEAHWVKLLR